MNKRSLWLAVLLIVLTGLLLAACQPAAPAATQAATEATGGGAVSGKITIWHSYHAGGAEEATISKNVELAKAEFPDLEIDVLEVPFDQIFNKYKSEVAAGGGPDMYVAPNDDLGNWVRSDLVANLDSLVTADDLSGVSQTGVDGMKVDGKLYGVPESAKAVALYYNKDKVAEPPKTTDELLEMVKGGNTLAQNLNGYHLFGWAPAFGGKLMDDTGKCVADQGGYVDALQFLLDLKDAGGEYQTDGNAADQAFRDGKVDMIINGPWVLGDYKESLGDKLGVALMPDGPSGHATPLNGIDGFYINPNSKNQEAAVRLAVFLTSGQSAQNYTDTAGHVPIRDSVTASDPLVAVFAQASSQGFPRPQTVEFGQYWGPFGDMYTKVLGEGATADPETAVKDACAAMNTATGK